MLFLLKKSYVSGHYRKHKSGAITFIPPHHNKVMPKHDDPLKMGFEQWRDTEIKRHLQHLKEQGKDTTSVKAYLEDHYTQALYDHHKTQIARVKAGEKPENIKKKEPPKIVFKKKEKPVDKLEEVSEKPVFGAKINPHLLALAKKHDKVFPVHGAKITDVTPKGYGPDGDSEPTHKTVEHNKAISSLNEIKTLLLGKMPKEKRDALEKAKTKAEYLVKEHEKKANKNKTTNSLIKEDNAATITPKVKQSTEGNKMSLSNTGTVEQYKNTGKFVALETGTGKPIRADGNLGSTYDPPLHDSVIDAENAIKARKKKNEYYQSQNTPENKAKKEAEKLEFQKKFLVDKALSIANTLAISVPDGYTLSSDGSDINIKGKFDDELHKRIKKAGGVWDKQSKSWFISYDEAEKSLSNVFKNYQKAIVKNELAKEEQQLKLENDAKEAAKKAANEKLDAAKKIAIEREKQPLIENGIYGQYGIVQSGLGYKVYFNYSADKVEKIKSLEHRTYDPTLKNWFVDRLSSVGLQKILNESKDFEESKKLIHAKNIQKINDLLIGNGLPGDFSWNNSALITTDEHVNDLVNSLIEQHKDKISKEKAHADGFRSFSSFYGPHQSIPLVGDVITLGNGEKIRVTSVDSHELSKKDIDWQEDAGQPGLDYGSSSVSIEGKVLSKEEAGLVKDKSYAKTLSKKTESEIIKNGEYLKSDDPSGVTVLNSHNIYGSGSSFVIGTENIWFVRGNSMDGDNWAINNSGGNMVWRIPYSKQVADDLIEADRIIGNQK